MLDSSCILFLIEAEMSRSPFLPSKFADYVGYRLPLLCVTPDESVVRDYLESYSLDVFLSDYSCDGILNTLRGLEKLGYCQNHLTNLSIDFGLEAVKKTYLHALES